MIFAILTGCANQINNISDEDNESIHQFFDYIYMPENFNFFTSDDLPASTNNAYEWLVPPILSSATHFGDNDRALVLVWNQELEDFDRFIGDIAGRVIATADTGELSHYFDGTALINRDSQRIAVDMEAKNITHLGYFQSFAPHPELGLISVRVGGWSNASDAGVIDMSGNVVVPTQFWDWIRGISEGLAVTGVRDPDFAGNGRWGFTDITTGEVVIPQTFGWVRPFSEGFAVVVVGPFTWQYDYKWGAINTRGELVVPAIYDGMMDFSEGLAAVRIERARWVDSKWGFVDATGRVVVPLIYDEVRSFSDGMAAVRVGNWSNDTRPKWGFVDRTGREVIPPIFENVGDFSEGLAAMQIDGRWGYIDQSGQMIIPPTFTLAWAFDDGFARVHYGGSSVWVQPCDGAPTPFGGEWRFINRNGETIVSLPYTYVGNV